MPIETFEDKTPMSTVRARINSTIEEVNALGEDKFNTVDLDIYNLTVKQPLESGYYTLATAIAAIPEEMRKVGLQITYNTAAGWLTYQFQGTIDAFTTTTAWINITATLKQDKTDNTLNTEDKTITGAINELRMETIEYNDLSNAVLTDTYVINSNNGDAGVSGTTQAATLDYLSCRKAKYIELTVPTGTNATVTYGIAFYDENKNFIVGYTRPTISKVSRTIKVYAVPSNAVYFRTSYFNSTNRPIYGDFSCRLWYDEIFDSSDEIFLDEREICDMFAMYATYEASTSRDVGYTYESSSLGLSSYINCKGVKEDIEITMPVLTTAPVEGLCFFNENKEVISGVLRPQGASNGKQIVKINVPENACYFKTTYWNYENAKTYGMFTCKIKYPKGILGENKKRPYQSGNIYFAPIVNQSVNNFWSIANQINTIENNKSSTGVLLLPPNYNPNGKPCPIIMYCHGYSHYVYYNQWGSTSSTTFMAQKQHWANLGFAVFDCNGARNNNKLPNFTGAGSLQFQMAYRKCFDYIKEHYNVEDKVCLIGGSAGGPTAINFAFNYSNVVKKIALLSPWTDLYLCSWGQGVKDTFVEYLGFSDTTTYEQNKAVGYDPALRILTIGTNEVIPQFPLAVKAWVGSTEVGSVLYAPLYRFINALRKGGISAYIREVEGLTHTDVVSGNNDVVDTEVAVWFNI